MRKAAGSSRVMLQVAPLNSEQPAVMKRRVQAVQVPHVAQLQAVTGSQLHLLLVMVASMQGQVLLLHGLLQHQQQLGCPSAAGQCAGARQRSSCLSSWLGGTVWAAGP